MSGKKYDKPEEGFPWLSSCTLSSNEVFNKYLLITPLGMKYWNTKELTKELEKNGYGICLEDGFKFHKYIPRQRELSYQVEYYGHIIPYSDYLKFNRIGNKYKIIDAILTIFTIIMMSYFSYCIAKVYSKHHPVEHRFGQK